MPAALFSLSISQFCCQQKDLGEYSYSLKDVINPQSGASRSTLESKAGSRKPSHMKVYKNPETGEVVQTKGGNHKTLKEWKAQYGSATVESG
ncbi:transcriptional regulator MvaT, P16 subunit, putative [Pseudomonas chlororaphis]|uniref:Transcriptional regulator MvaT, P16 subunit, putative n=1 Tax=Pseudomonas chlororaphis TaxID=587753 RepID=A0A3G7TLL6_9PSED|nr:histone-like nucleoid-structuring protein, MvaT/MvaU family [Pseudomonas chlororaphis]AZE47229.1 transcriptional regulator MvaT, P16 subunit, putative [Pseudomonas chlororaphis]